MILSILGLYKADDTIFNDMVIPQGLDKETLINNLLMECAELEVLYPNPQFMKDALYYWSKLKIDEWNKLYETMHYEYNPIWNKDGTIREVETRDLQGTQSNQANSNNEDISLYDTNAYNEGPYANRDKTTNTGSNTSTLEGSNTDTGTIERVRDEKGNIGLTSTQELIKQEREIIINLYKIIIDDFKQRFTILVY